MLEWLLVLVIVALGAASFAILFKAEPTADTTDLQGEKLRNDLAKMSLKDGKKKKEEQKKKPEKPEKKQKQKEEKKKQKVLSEEEEEEEVEEVKEKPKKEIYIPNVPIHNNTPTTKPKQLDPTRSRSPIKEEKVEKPKVEMPSKKQIEHDLNKGFVVVQKKGPPPLTEDQKKERDELRRKEEEEEKKRERDILQREKDLKEARLKKATGEGPTEGDGDAMKKLKERLEQERKAKLEEKEKKQAPAVGQVKTFGRVSQAFGEGEDVPPPRLWDKVSAAEVNDEIKRDFPLATEANTDSIDSD